VSDPLNPDPTSKNGPLGFMPLDLSKPYPGYEVKITPSETEKQEAVRLKTQYRREWIADGIWITLFGLLIAWTCIFLWVFLFKDNATSEQRDLSQKLLPPLISGAIAFVLGRASSK